MKFPISRILWFYILNQTSVNVHLNSAKFISRSKNIDELFKWKSVDAKL